MARKEIINKAGSIVDGMISNYVPDEICNSYYRGFREGATLADQTLIDKACEWMEKTFFDICDLSKRSDYIEVVSKHKKKRDLIEDFKRALEE